MNISDLTPTHDSQRWYRRDGTGICSEVIGKTNGSPRPPTLRDARELGLLPGVTGINKIYPGSLNWWSQDIRVAGEVGTRRHARIEAFHKKHATMIDKADEPFVMPYYEWYAKTVYAVLEAESVAVSLEHGYAGTMDLHCCLQRQISDNDGLERCMTAVVDLKNRKNPATYDTDAMQLAAYRRAVGADVGISVILGTAQPEILVKEWTPAEDELAWTRFSLCLALWKSANGYYPESWKE